MDHEDDQGDANDELSVAIDDLTDLFGEEAAIAILSIVDKSRTQPDKPTPEPEPTPKAAPPMTREERDDKILGCIRRGDTAAAAALQEKPEVSHSRNFIIGMGGAS